MADIQRLIDTMARSGAINRIARNRLAQFGTRTRPRIGAEILPVQEVSENSFTDDTVRYRTVVGNAGTRYSPVVLKGNVYSGSVKVELFDIDLGSELTSKDYDALIAYLNRNDSIQATASLTNFVDTTVNQGLEDLREVYRWQAIESALVQRRGANGYKEDIAYSNPASHRAAAAAAWSNNATEPMTDIFNRIQLLSDKGFKVGRILSTRSVVSILGNNDKMKTRVGHVKVNVTNGAFITASGRASLAAINSAMSDEGLPPITLLDEIYRKQDGTTGRFISNNVMIFLGLTGRDAQLVVGDNDLVNELLPDVLGYYGVGRAAGQSGPGRVILTKFKDDKPPRVEVQGWETSAPVITEPEAIATITGIA